MNKLHCTISSLLFLLLLVSMSFPLVSAYPPVSLVEVNGPLTVDGDITDWDVDLSDPESSVDFFVKLYDGWNNNGKNTVLGYSFIRYDSTNDIVYVLMLSKSGVVIVQGEPDDAQNWVAIDTISNKVVDEFSDNNLVPPDFEFVAISGELRGYEASFKLAQGRYQIAIHSLTILNPTEDDDNTIGTEGTFVYLELPPDFVVPEVSAVFAIVSMAGATGLFAVYKRRNKH